jgi:hypothetical protein
MRGFKSHLLLHFLGELIMLTYYDDSPTVTAVENGANNTLGSVKMSTMDSTADCVKVLNYVIGQGNWKRVAKKDFSTGYYYSTPIRTFEDKTSGKVVSIQWHEGEEYGDIGNAWIYDFDLRLVKDEIEQVKDFCNKHYVDPDGGTIYYDPAKKRVLLSASDGFFIYTDDSSKSAQVKIDAIDYWEYNKDWTVDPNKHIDLRLTFLTEALYIDESALEPQHGFIQLGGYKSLSDCNAEY